MANFQTAERTLVPVAGYSYNKKQIFVAICGYFFSANKSILLTKKIRTENLLLSDVSKIFFPYENEVEKKNLSFEEKSDAEKLNELCVKKQIFLLSEKSESFKEDYGTATIYTLYVPKELLNFETLEKTERKINSFQKEIAEGFKFSLKVSIGKKPEMVNKDFQLTFNPEIVEDLEIKNSLSKIQNIYMEKTGSPISLETISNVMENLEIFKF
jgi:hypothetical protein